MGLHRKSSIPAFCILSERLIIFALLLLCAILVSGCGATQGGGQPEEADVYPVEEIEFVVGVSPGGGYDTWARGIAPFLEKHLPGNPAVVVRNVTGAGGQIAASQVYAARPDGSTIHMINLGGLAAAQVASEDLNFDLSEFTPIARAARDPQVVVVAGDSEINTVEDLREAAPVKQAITSFTASTGVNTVILYEALGIDYEAITHEGSSESRLSIVRGDTQAGIFAVESVAEDVKAGDLKPILFIGEEKPDEGEPGYEEVRDTQPVEEVGAPELASFLETQRVIVAPPDLPDDIKGLLGQAMLDAMEDPEFLEHARETGQTADPLGPEETEELIDNQIEDYSEYAEPLKEALAGEQ